MRPAKPRPADAFKNLSPIPGTMSIDPNSDQPEPVGTIILQPYQLLRYARNADGNLIACVRPIDGHGNSLTGNELAMPIDPNHTLVVEDREELRSLFSAAH